MQMNLKKLVGAAAIAGALGLPTFVVGAGAANAATDAAPIAVDWHGDGWGDCDWCRHGGWDGGWDGGWRGDGDWHRGGWLWGGPWGWHR